MAFAEGVAVGAGSGSGTGVAVALGDGDGAGVGLGVGVEEGVACGCPKAYFAFPSERLCSIGWPITKENDNSPIATHTNKTAAGMATRVFILFATSLVVSN